MKLRICLIILGIFIHQSIDGAIYPSPSCTDSANFLLINGAEIHYELSGPSTGQTIVFIAGTGDGAEVWGCYRNFFCAQGYQTLLIDMRGQGFSRAPANAPYTIAQMASDVNGVLSALGIVTPVYIVGWSIGGAIAQYYAATYPAQVSKVVLFDTGPKFVNSNGWTFGPASPIWVPYITTMARLNAITNSMVPSLAAFDGLTGTEICAVTNLELATLILGALIPTGLISDPQAQTQIFTQGDVQWDGRDLLSSIAAPTLIIYGCSDPLTPPAESIYLSQNIPNAKIVGVQGYSHDTAVFTTDFCENLMLNFFQGNPITSDTSCTVNVPCSSCVVPL